MCVFGSFKCRDGFINIFLQMKQANFDVSHELDEFLMVEKPLTHTKRKANADLDKLKPVLRHLEEQYVPSLVLYRIFPLHKPLV